MDVVDDVWVCVAVVVLVTVLVDEHPARTATTIRAINKRTIIFLMLDLNFFPPIFFIPKGEFVEFSVILSINNFNFKALRI